LIFSNPRYLPIPFSKCTIGEPIFSSIKLLIVDSINFFVLLLSVVLGLILMPNISDSDINLICSFFKVAPILKSPIAIKFFLSPLSVKLRKEFQESHISTLTFSSFSLSKSTSLLPIDSTQNKLRKLSSLIMLHILFNENLSSVSIKALGFNVQLKSL
jgi:hypothetical protein